MFFYLTVIKSPNNKHFRNRFLNNQNYILHQGYKGSKQIKKNLIIWLLAERGDWCTTKKYIVKKEKNSLNKMYKIYFSSSAFAVSPIAKHPTHSGANPPPYVFNTEQFLTEAVQWQLILKIVHSKRPCSPWTCPTAEQPTHICTFPTAELNMDLSHCGSPYSPCTCPTAELPTHLRSAPHRTPYSLNERGHQTSDRHRDL